MYMQDETAAERRLARGKVVNAANCVVLLCLVVFQVACWQSRETCAGALELLLSLAVERSLLRRVDALLDRCKRLQAKHEKLSRRVSARPALLTAAAKQSRAHGREEKVHSL